VHAACAARCYLGRSTYTVDLTAVEEGPYLVVLRGMDMQHVVRVIKGW